MDVYYKEAERAYYLVGVKQSDVRCENGVYMIDEDAYAVTLVNEKMIKQGQIRADLEKLGYEFRMSFYRNDIIEYEKDGKLFRERFLSRTKPNNRNYIETKPINRAKYEKQNLVGLGKTKKIKKYRMDILGNYYSCEKEEFSKYC
jgi:CRISPR-associated endonuclease Csn1